MTAIPASVLVEAPVLNSAMEHVSSQVRVPVVAPEDRAGDIRASLVGVTFDTAVSIVVCRDSRLVGMLRMEDLLSAPDNVTAAALMDDTPPTLTQGSELETVAWKAAHHGDSTLAVIDDERRLVGLIPPYKLLTALLADHDEDMARLGGFLRAPRQRFGQVERRC